MKAVHEITDRAKRYRANALHRKRKRCECVARNHGHGRICGSRQNLGIGHLDGDESNGKPSNLFTVCKSCNAMQAVDDKKAGRGVRTRQYNPKQKRRNPGAKTLGAYVDAAVNHTRGAHDAGGKIIHDTPKVKRMEFAREIWFRRGHNPKELSQSKADELYRKFHGRGPDETRTLLVTETDPYGSHPELAQLGFLLRFIVGEGIKLTGEYGDEVEDVSDGNGWAGQISLVPMKEWRRLEETMEEKQLPIAEIKRWLRTHEAPDVAAEPSAKQIYIVGGNQNIDAQLGELGVDPTKEFCDLGNCYFIEYFTQKRFDKFKLISYWHHFGDKTGVVPRLTYDRLHHRLCLVGGEYEVKPAGITN